MLRGRTVFGLFLLLLALKVAGELYDWAAHRQERERLGAVRERLVDAGVALIRAEARLDTLRRELEGGSQVLEEERSALDAYEARMKTDPLPPEGYALYRDRVERFNRRAERHNAKLREWNAAVARKEEALGRYATLADSARALARALREPLYPIPSPAEAAVERGVIRPLP
jgi:chromosome segregation ATPase